MNIIFIKIKKCKVYSNGILDFESDEINLNLKEILYFSKKNDLKTYIRLRDNKYNMIIQTETDIEEKMKKI